MGDIEKAFAHWSVYESEPPIVFRKPEDAARLATAVAAFSAGWKACLAAIDKGSQPSGGIQAELDRYKAAVERVLAKLDALASAEPVEGIRWVCNHIRSAIGDVGDVPAQQTQDEPPDAKALREHLARTPVHDTMAALLDDCADIPAGPDPQGGEIGTGDCCLEVTTTNQCGPTDVVITYHWASSRKLTRDQAERALKAIRAMAAMERWYVSGVRKLYLNPLNGKIGVMFNGHTVVGDGRTLADAILSLAGQLEGKP